jgi:hypothetical protein
MATSKTIPLWLFPVAYLIHAIEEFFGGEGLPLTPHRMRGFNLTPVQFIIINSVALLLLIFGLYIARRRGFPHLLMVIVGSIMLVNGSLHVLTAIRTSAYTPGLITSPLVFIPLGAWTLVSLFGDMSWLRYCTGVALGGGVHVIISLLAHNGRNLFGH